MEITENWLMDTGGWQAMKAGRGLWSAGAVLSAEYDGTRLTGQVREGGKVFASGLKITGRTNVETLCTCRQAQRDGIICSHALAVGVGWVRRGKSPDGQPVNGPAAAVPVRPAAAKASGPLTFVITSDFVSGLARGRFAAGVQTGPADLIAQAPDMPFLTWLGTLRQSAPPPHLALPDAALTNAFLRSVTGHPRIEWRQGGKRTLLTVSAEAPVLDLTLTSRGEAVRLSVKAPAGAVAALPPDANRGWLWEPESATLRPLEVPGELAPLLTSLAGAPLERPRLWLAGQLAKLQDVFRIDPDTSDPELLRLRMVPARPQFELTLDGTLERLGAQLRCAYPGGPPPFPPGGEASGFPLPLPDGNGYAVRDPAAEDSALERLLACGFESSGGSTANLLLKREGAILQFFAGELEHLRREWTVTFSPRFAKAAATVERVVPQWTPAGSGEDWLAFDMQFASAGGVKIEAAEIARMLATGTGHRKLPNGRTAVVSLTDAAEVSEALRDARPDQRGGSFRVARSQGAFLAEVFGGALEAARSWPLAECVPAALRDTLRDYQKAGVQWMLDSTLRGGGGILADEMGLGKTLQTLTFLAALRQHRPGRPALVVCPKSLLGNWQEEARRFVPELSCVVLDGPRRSAAFAGVAGAGLVLTSYPLLVRDEAVHAAQEWNAVILDEAGFIRNPDTQAAGAARALQAGARFALTGTPVENGVRDLWSLMEFALPGYLGPRADFRDRYEQPLAAGGAPKVMARLRRRLAPWLLRRLKREVARDLPEKIEMVRTCPLTDTQQGLYTALLKEGAGKVTDATNAKNRGQARLHMLTALLRLRQTCCDPRLLPGREEDAPDLSGKLDVLAELLEEIRDGGHSVIIFSAFARMLRLIETVVKESGLGHCLLDGQTRDRAAQVSAFQKDPDKRVFLISLKAGGFGLNLTKADTVIHFDPWWNPAVEAQATDRAHRIGQDRAVSVYKLIAAGTVEEKILRLQAKKRGLMEAALDDNAPLMEGLTDEDLQDLLSVSIP